MRRRHQTPSNPCNQGQLWLPLHAHPHESLSALAPQAKQTTGATALVADPAPTAQAEKLAQLKADAAEMQKKEAEGERKQKERAEADERSRQLRGGV
tara:strand:- start:3 stop:293 length:291 start_codon:yes stop_codon:yes gene_type:complete